MEEREGGREGRKRRKGEEEREVEIAPEVDVQLF